MITSRARRCHSTHFQTHYSYSPCAFCSYKCISRLQREPIRTRGHKITYFAHGTSSYWRVFFRASNVNVMSLSDLYSSICLCFVATYTVLNESVMNRVVRINTVAAGEKQLMSKPGMTTPHYTAYIWSVLGALLDCSWQYISIRGSETCWLDFYPCFYRESYPTFHLNLVHTFLCSMVINDLISFLYEYRATCQRAPVYVLII